MDYSFPTEKLRAVQTFPGKVPLVLVSCGSFSPVTYLHLRMFEMAADFIREQGEFELIGGYFSPVNQKYGKKGLAPAQHRVAMCRSAVEMSDWLMVDEWEAIRPEYQTSANVLNHFGQQIRRLQLPCVQRGVRIMLLAGGDLITSFGTPGVWSPADLHHILGNYGCFVIERTGTDVWGFLLSHDILYRHRRKVFVVKQLIYNDISSTKVRLFVRRQMSIRYLVPDTVIKYIEMHRLYTGEGEDDLLAVQPVVTSASSTPPVTPVPSESLVVVVTVPAPSQPTINGVVHVLQRETDPESSKEPPPNFYTNVAQVSLECDDQPPPRH